MKKILYLLMFMLISNLCYADELGSLSKALSGESSKTWQLKASKPYLGGKGCNEGISYTFHNNGLVQIKECLAGSVKTEEISWVLKQTSIDHYLILDKTKYRLIYVSSYDDELDSTFEKVILRIDGESKSQKTEDLMLSHVP